MRLTPPCLTLPALALVALAAPLNAQTLSGQVVDSITRAPVGAGFVVLLDADGAEISRTLTSRNGRFTFTLAPNQPGPLSLRSERIGYRVAVTEPFEIPRQRALEFTVWVEALPTPLSAIEVHEATECTVRPTEDEQTAVVWEEARKALAAASWTASQQLFHVVSNVYDRDTDPRRGRLLNEVHRPSIGFSLQPFVSRAPAELLRNGYVVADGESVVYAAPDAEVLHDERFLATHCFRLRRGEGQRADLIGLAFEPVPSRDLPDVEGVLWLDRQSSELRSLEYRYTNLPRELRAGDPGGGTVEFMPLPSGAWIVHRWHIRIPTAFRDVRVDPFARESRRVVVEFRDTGGEVLTITDGAGNRVYQAVLADLTGVVVDSTRGEPQPLAGAIVRIAGTWFADTTDERGRFHLGAPLNGEYDVGFAHPRVALLAYAPPLARVTLARGRTDTLRLAVPSMEAIVRGLCPDQSGANARVLVGTVRDSVTGKPVQGVQVAASWQQINSNLDFRNRQAVATTDASGTYTLCNLEHGRPAVVYAVGENARSAPIRIAFEGTGVEVGEEYHQTAETAAGLWRWDVTLRPRLESSALVVGLITDVSTGNPIPGAVVTIGDSALTTETDSTGMFQLEGPSAGIHRLTLRRPGYQPRWGEVEVHADQPTIIGAEFLALTPAAQVTGAVTDPETDDPVSDVWVTLVSLEGDSVMMTFSDSLGGYVLTAPAAGSYYVSARRLGYSPDFQGPYELQPGQAVDVAFSMRRLAFVLDPLNVTAEAVDQFLERVGFNHRKKFNRGYFMDREEIEKRLGSVADAPQLLSVVPGVEIVGGLSNRVGGSLIRISRAAGASVGGCDAKGPRIWVDGFLIDTQNLSLNLQLYAMSQVVQPEAIYAIEVYRSPSQVPMQYGGPQSLCGVVLIWTARGR